MNPSREAKQHATLMLLSGGGGKENGH